MLGGKTAVVTGGTRGVGRTIAQALADAGAAVVVIARNAEAVARSVEELQTRGGRAAGLAADVTDPTAPERIVHHAAQNFGGLDVLVNCAGYFVRRRFTDLSAEDWQRSLATNLTAPHALSLAAARVMAEQQRGGSIIHIGSVHAAVGDADAVPQCASKAGLEGLTRGMAEALRPQHIRVNTVAPGAIAPGGTADRRHAASPQQRVTAADVASMVVYLASDQACSISGAVFPLYGETRPLLVYS